MSNRDGSNKMILDNVIRTIQLSAVKVERGTNNSYLPSLERGNVVCCEYTGLGMEYNDTHFAIVWNASPKDENIVIIPMTSQSKQEAKKTFTIGYIPNFITIEGSLSVKESWLHLTKMSEVSRKRIKPWFQVNTTTGQNITDMNGKNLLVKLNTDQIIRIKEGIKLFYLEEGNCLIDYLQTTLNANWVFDVTTISTNILLHGYRETKNFNFIQNDANTASIAYELCGVIYNIPLKKIDDAKFISEHHKNLYTSCIKYIPNKYNRRKRLISALFSNDNNFVNEAKRLIKEII